MFYIGIICRGNLGKIPPFRNPSKLQGNLGLFVIYFILLAEAETKEKTPWVPNPKGSYNGLGRDA
jgi:hypothetical protein